MRFQLLITLSLLFAACADHNGSVTLSADTSSPTNGSGKPDVVTRTVDKQPKPSTEQPVPETPSECTDNPPADPGDGTDGVIIGSGPVPEPSTLLLVGTGLAGAAMLGRRRKSNNAS